MRPRIFPFLLSLAELKRQQWWDPDRLTKLQSGRLTELGKALERIPHYAESMEANGINARDVASDISSMPILRKEEIQGRQPQFLNPQIPQGRLKSISTSGSTGTPLELFIDNDALDHRIALKYLAETEFGLRHSDLFAEISHNPYTPHPLLRMSGLYRRMPLSVFDSESSNFTRLLECGPDVLGWYPSYLTLLASINDSYGRPLKLRQIYCGSETLSASARSHLESSFGCTVLSQYGATEFSTIAWECPEERSLHLNAASCLLEIVDEKGNPRRRGAGKVVITSLHNRAMPLVRYSIGDMAAWGKGCPCGRGLPVLESIRGRANDIITLPSGRRRNSVSLDIFYGIPGILSYQLVQEREDLFLFRYCSNWEIGKKSRDEVLRRVSRGCLGEPVRVGFERVDALNHSPSGKLSTVISKVKCRTGGM